MLSRCFAAFTFIFLLAASIGVQLPGLAPDTQGNRCYFSPASEPGADSTSQSAWTALKTSQLFSADEAIATLEKNWGVTIAGSGERLNAADKRCNLKECRPAEGFSCRQPHNYELQETLYTLQKLFPAGSNLKKKLNIKLYFLNNAPSPGCLAEWQADSHQRARILISSEYRQSQVPLRQVLIHELGHHSCHQLGMNPTHPQRWSILNELGWVYKPNCSWDGASWLLKSKEEDNVYFRHQPDKDVWIQCNEKGAATKLPAPALPRGYFYRHVTSERMRELATCPPVSNYFINPAEMVAEALAYFRHSKIHRSQLLQKSPQLYKIAKQLDQEELDLLYGVNAMTRLPDGSLIANSRDSHQNIIAFETTAAIN